MSSSLFDTTWSAEGPANDERTADLGSIDSLMFEVLGALSVIGGVIAVMGSLVVVARRIRRRGAAGNWCRNGRL